MVREAHVAAKRRLWLIIGSQLMREENKPFFFVPVLLFLLFRDSHYQSGITSPVTSCCFWSGREDGAGGLCLATQTHLSGSRTKKMALRK